ncbi:MAG: S9 family peptidase [Bacteroidetes bacterium]|nr:S9 family peptidase [Bacteroidota bacterium]
MITKNKIESPVAEKIPKKLKIHGHTRIDNYFWMNERNNPKVLAQIETENIYTKKTLYHTEDLQKKIYYEIIVKIKQDDSTVPYFDNGYYYYTRFAEGNEYPIYCRKKDSLTPKEEIMLNVNHLAEGLPYISVIGLVVSPDNNWLAFGVDKHSRRMYDIFIKDLSTGLVLNYSIPNTAGNPAWANDNSTIFYSGKDEKTLRSDKIFKHKIGQNPLDDQLIYHEIDEEYSTLVQKSRSKNYIFICSSHTLATEYQYLNADTPDDIFKIILPREHDIKYYVDHCEESFFILTNFNAKNFRIIKTPISNTAKQNWTEIIPHRKDVLLESLFVFKNYLVVKEVNKGLDFIRIKNCKHESDYTIEFDEKTYSASISPNPETDSNLLRFVYSSFKTPNSVYDFDMETGKRILLKQDQVLGDFNPESYNTDRIYVTSRDGLQIPVSLIYKKGIKFDGQNPLLLSAYGAYGYSADQSFRSFIFSLIDRGFIYAIAHVRGGQEMGRQWYENGKLLKKKNTFYDFIDCSEYLIRSKYTSNNKLFIYGGSAGGLLIAAVINMAPQLFKAAIAAVPFVDVVTTMLDDSIPLTTVEYDEWGNPHQKEYYDYMLSYSPYDNVEKKNYPAILAIAGFNDSQVQYWEPLKWITKLRQLKTDSNPLLLDCDMDSGHVGASGRFSIYKVYARMFAFLLDQLSINE